MTATKLLQIAFNNAGKYSGEYSKPVERIVRQLKSTQIQTEQGEFSVIFLDKIDKKANIIEFILSKTALNHQALLLKNVN